MDSMEEIISSLLSGGAELLDVPTELHEQAVARYEDVGNWLGGTGGPAWEIYPQGSFRLGTVVAPFGPSGAYDIDLVCRRELAKESTTQEELKGMVGEMLDEYLKIKADEGGDGPRECAPSRRCWTLDYPGHGFHLDVLPAIPDRDHEPTSILLTDVNLRNWQHSNPIGYARWFRTRSEEMLAILEKLARADNVAEVPEYRVRTTLQRLVQVLKWHCAIRFAADPENRPPSILITTLAARAYNGESDLFSAALNAVRQMPAFVEYRNGRWWVPNPVHEAENFADKWNEYPQRRTKFLAWLKDITALLEEVARMRGRGLDEVVVRLGESFGIDPIRKAAERYGDGVRGLREAGSLSIAAGTGLLTQSGGRTLPNHTFFGAHGR